MSGKVGRPPEDRLLRQREIFRAVSPLIMERGASRVTMREAAAAACLSLGGLHHYFPTKRDLVLHGLRQEAFDRVCHDFFELYRHLQDDDPEAFVAQYVEFQIDQVTFIGPSLHAALEMGAEVFMSEMEAGMQNGLDGFIAALLRIVPDSDLLDLRPLARGIRRTLLGAVLDRLVTREELRQELWALINAARQASARTLPGAVIPVLSPFSRMGSHSPQVGHRVDERDNNGGRCWPRMMSGDRKGGSFHLSGQMIRRSAASNR